MSIQWMNVYQNDKSIFIGENGLSEGNFTFFLNRAFSPLKILEKMVRMGPIGQFEGLLGIGFAGLEMLG